LTWPSVLHLTSYTRLSRDDATQTVKPDTVRGYLKRAFKDNLGAVQDAMQQLANAYSPEDIGKKGYDFYVDFRCFVQS